MKHRTLARSLDVSAIGIGCMPMIRGGNILYGQADDGVSTRTIHEAIDLGVTFERPQRSGRGVVTHPAGQPAHQSAGRAGG
jgi:hypothetical protein